MKVSAEVENLLAAGHATSSTAVSTGSMEAASLSTCTAPSTSSSYGGPAQPRGIVSLPHEIEAAVESGAAPLSDRRPNREAPLRDVRGPSALGGGTRRFFDLLWLMSVTEFKRVYFGTVLGYLWSLIRPLMLFGVLLFVFTKVFSVGSDGRTLPGAAAARDRPLHLLPGIDDELGHLGGRPGGRGPQDPVPPPGDPARHRAHRRSSTSVST